AGVALSDRIRKLYGDLFSLQKHTDQTIADCVAQVNTLAQEIAKINKEITGVVSAGNSPNDLLDRRALLIEELSQFVRVEVHGLNSSELMLSIGGKNLVQGTHVNEISVVQGTGLWSDIVWSDDNSAVLVKGGQIKGLLYVRDISIQESIDSLNTITSGLINGVNTIYSEGHLPNGSPAGNFFVPNCNASNIEVEWALISNPSMLATGTSGTISDNSIALNISDLRNQPTIDGETIGDAYNSLIARIGANAREAQNQHSVQVLSTHQLKLQRSSMSGVSIDEEMVNMIKYQQAYNAAARIISVLDEMLDTLISRTGISGR
ncbi:MAG: flagellar hook-associated protein FlgK, partial [Armatimonadota bacterium]|nr:flagellar hook-associated protein FlgK [Armatimonadota bacterium]